MLRQLYMTLNFYQVNRAFSLSDFPQFFNFHSPLNTVAVDFRCAKFVLFPYVLPKWPESNSYKVTSSNAFNYINFTQNSSLKNAYKVIKAFDSEQLSQLLKDYQIFKYSQSVKSNPINVSNTFYQWAVSYNLSAEVIKLLIIEHCNIDFNPDRQPFWSAVRSGQSRTELADGRIVLIGGENHEPFNYLIYHDVIVMHPNGNVKVYNYPQKLFNCPELHTATLVSKGADESIIIIGSNNEHTSVYRLNTHDFKIEQLVTRNSMGWIQGHNATLKNHQIIVTGGEQLIEDTMILVDNIDSWSLNLKTLIWKNLTNNHRHWQHFYVIRQDYDSIHLQDYHALDCYLKLNETEIAANQVASLKKYCNISSDIDSYRQLFSPPIDHEIIMDTDAVEDIAEYNENIVFNDYRNHTLYIDGIKVRYKTDIYHIQVIIEGKLSEDKLELLQQNLRHKLSKIENMAYEVVEI